MKLLKKLNVWLSNKVRRNELKYLIFPEYHKEKAIHFHGLCSGKLILTDSGKQTKDGHAIFNCDSWSYGFSTVMEIYGIQEQVVNYVMKYSTKDCQKIFGKYYLSGGKNLFREVPTSYPNIDFDAFQGEQYAIASTSDFLDADGDGLDDRTYQDEWTGGSGDPTDPRPDGGGNEGFNDLPGMLIASGIFGFLAFLKDFFSFIPAPIFAIMSVGIGLIVILRIAGRSYCFA